MPRCSQGHECGLVLVCPVCKADVDYSGALADIARLPTFKLDFEETAVLFAGVPVLRVPGTFGCSIELAQEELRSDDSYLLKKMAAGNWLEYLKSCAISLSSWERLVGFPRAKQTLVVADTRDPLSVLAISSLSKVAGMMSFLVTADAESTPTEQNTCYAAISLAQRNRIPVVLATASRANELACFVEGQGLVMGEAAFGRVIMLVLTAARSVSDFMLSDLKIGVSSHYFSSIMAASDQVYASPSGVFDVLETQLSGEVQAENVYTAYLVSSSKPPVQDELGPAFDRFCKRFPNLINKESAHFPKETRLGFYDVLVLFGVKESETLRELQQGYERVAKRNEVLRVESLDKIA